MTDEETRYAHGDTQGYEIGCRACPADQKPACNNTPCFGGYWVPVDVFNILRLRGMSGGSDT